MMEQGSERAWKEIGSGGTSFEKKVPLLGSQLCKGPIVGTKKDQF